MGSNIEGALPPSNSSIFAAGIVLAPDPQLPHPPNPNQYSYSPPWAISSLANFQFEQNQICYADPQGSGEAPFPSEAMPEVNFDQSSAGSDDSSSAFDSSSSRATVATDVAVYGTVTTLLATGSQFSSFGPGYLASRVTSVTVTPILEEMGVTNPYLLRGIEFGSFWPPNAISFGLKKVLGWSAYRMLGTKIAASTLLRATNVVGWVAFAAELTLKGAEYALVRDPYMRSVMLRAKMRWKEEVEGVKEAALVATDFLVSSLADSLVPKEYLAQIEAEDEEAIRDFYNMLGGALLVASLQCGGDLTDEVVEMAFANLFAQEGGREYFENMLALIALKKGDFLPTFEQPLVALADGNFSVDANLIECLKKVATVDYYGDGNGVPLIRALNAAKTTQAAIVLKTSGEAS
jgi:hypothetical protein